jgi:hypothetical protein
MTPVLAAYQLYNSTAEARAARRVTIQSRRHSDQAAA